MSPAVFCWLEVLAIGIVAGAVFTTLWLYLLDNVLRTPYLDVDQALAQHTNKVQHLFGGFAGNWPDEHTEAFFEYSMILRRQWYTCMVYGINTLRTGCDVHIIGRVGVQGEYRVVDKVLLIVAADIPSLTQYKDTLLRWNVVIGIGVTTICKIVAIATSGQLVWLLPLSL